MNDLSTEEIYQEVGRIVSRFKVLECDSCAKAILEWLDNNGIEKRLLRLKTKYRERFIVSLRLEQLGISDSITQNGIHYGIEVRGRVFDNLSREGLPKEEWLDDFRCQSSEFILEELEGF